MADLLALLSMIITWSSNLQKYVAGIDHVSLVLCYPDSKKVVGCNDTSFMASSGS